MKTASAQRACTLFVAVPSGGAYAQEMEVMRHACNEFGANAHRPLRVLSGDDAPTTEPPEVRAWIREALVSEADGVAIVHGPSWGCSREDTLAGELGLPRLLLFRGSDPTSVLAGEDGTDTLARGAFDSLPELDAALKGWLGAYYDDMRAYQGRRAAADELSQPFRIACLRVWSMLDHADQSRIAHELGLTTAQVDRILMSPRHYSERHEGFVLQLATKLQVWDPATRRLRSDTQHDPLPDTRRRAFEQAKRTWRWDDATAAAVLAEGIRRVKDDDALLAAGQPSRYSLDNRFGWLKIYQELCGGQGS